MPLHDLIAAEIDAGNLPDIWTTAMLLENPTLAGAYAISTLRTHPANHSITAPGIAPEETGKAVQNGAAAHYYRFPAADGGMNYCLIHHFQVAMFANPLIPGYAGAPAPLAGIPPVPPPAAAPVPIPVPMGGPGAPNFWGFIAYLDAALAAIPDPGYNWGFAIRYPPAWLNTPPAGNTLVQAGVVLDCARAVAWSAITQGNPIQLLESIQVIMDWGGVFYPQGPRGNNQASITAMHNNGTLLPRVRSDLAALIAGRWSDMTLMNSGWTKVWAVLCGDRAIMFDSRVSYCLGTHLRAYLGGQPLPPDLPFHQTVAAAEGRRHVAGLPVATNGGARAEATGLASGIVCALSQFADQLGPRPGAWHFGLSSRELEGRIFMLGA